MKSQLSRKHGMQSLGKVPSARRPPANLPSLKTESGQDTNANCISSTATVTSTPPVCTTQTMSVSSSSNAAVGGWVSLPPPSSPHFRTEFPSLEASTLPSHRTADQQPTQLRPQMGVVIAAEGSWTCGGTVATRQETSAPPQSQQTPALRAIMPPFLMKGSAGGGGGGAGPGLSALGRESRRPPPRVPPPQRAQELLTARPILRADQIHSLDDIARDAGWAQHDDIDYDQKLDFSDGETSGPVSTTRGNKSNRSNIESERIDTKLQDPGDEEQIWAERRQKQNNEVAQAVARARQIKEEEQRRQMREALGPPATTQGAHDPRHERNDKDHDLREKDRNDRDSLRNDNREKDSRPDIKDRDSRPDNRDRDSRSDPRDRDSRADVKDRDSRLDAKDRETRPDIREREKDRMERDRYDSRDNRDRMDRVQTDNRSRGDRERTENLDKDRENRDRDRNDIRDRMDRDRYDRDRDFRDRDRDRDRDYGRDREQNSYAKNFQTNIPPRFLKQQQNRQQEDKGWSFNAKTGGARRTEPQQNYPPRHAPHNGRRSYSRDFSDREDEFRRDKDGGQQWRSEMQDYDRSGRDIDRQSSRDYDYKDKRNENDRKSVERPPETNTRASAADKLTEVFERKSIGLVEPFANSAPQNDAVERRQTPPSNTSHRESSERDFSLTSWAEASPDPNDTKEHPSYALISPSFVKNAPKSENTDNHNRINENIKELPRTDKEDANKRTHTNISQPTHQQSLIANIPSNMNHLQAQMHKFHNVPQHANVSYPNTQSNVATVQPMSSNQSVFAENLTSRPSNHAPKSGIETISSSQSHNVSTTDKITSHNVVKPVFMQQKHEKELSESESIASKSSTDPSCVSFNKHNELQSTESLPVSSDSQKKASVIDEKRSDRFNNEQLSKFQNKDPIERKSSGSGSEKKGRGYGGYAVYGRSWGARESRGRRPNRSSRSNNRASESDGSTDGAPNERKERRRAPRSPRGKKPDRPEEQPRTAVSDHVPPQVDVLENQEPFAPRGQPSRRGRGGFHGTQRPPAPAKRVTGYGPPNTKSPFSQANRAVKESENDIKDMLQADDKNKNKPRNASSTRRPEGGRGRDRKPKGAGPASGEDENWETTSEHSEGGGQGGRRRTSQPKTQGGRSQQPPGRQNNARQLSKKDTNDVTEAMSDLKLANKKEEEVQDDGFQEVRNKRNSKDTRGGPPSKEDLRNSPKLQQQQRSHSNQSGNRNGSSSRNNNDKPQGRGSAPVSGKPATQYDRSRYPNLAPRFVKQRQKQQMGLVPGFAQDPGAAPPPPPVNAWDKPLRSNLEETADPVEIKSGHSSHRSTPGDMQPDTKMIINSLSPDKTGVLDGATPPVETIIFENTNYKTAPPAEALKQKYQPSAATVKPQTEEIVPEVETRTLSFNGDARQPAPRSIQELIAENGRPNNDAENSLAMQISFEANQKTEDSSDMKLDFAFDSDLGQLTEDKSAKTLGLPRSGHSMGGSNTISPLAADLNLKIASVKKVWEMPAVAETGEELQFSAFEESATETGAPPNVCKVKPTQQLQSPPPQHYNHVGYQGYGGLSVPSPPAVMFNSSQPLLGSSQQLPQQGGLYGAFLEQNRGQFGGFPPSPYGAGSAAPYNYQPPPDMFQSLPNQYRMAAAAGGGAAFGQTGQLANNPSTVLISSSSNSLMSATGKPTSQQIGAIGSKGGGVGAVGGVGGVGTYQTQQYLGYSGPVGDSPYSLPGLMPRPAPPANSYYSQYQHPSAPAPTFPLQFTQPGQSGAFGSQYISSQLQVAAAVQQMQQQYRTPLQQQFAPPRPPPQLKSPLHEHPNGFALCEASSPKPAPVKPQKPHSPPHKYHHTHHVPPQMVGVTNVANSGRAGGARNNMGSAPRYPAPIQRPPSQSLVYRSAPRPHQRPPAYYQQQRSGAGSGAEADSTPAEESSDAPKDSATKDSKNE